MTKFKAGNIVSLMLLVWLFVHAVIAFFAPQWSAFASIVACTVPMLLFKEKHRGSTFGAKECNTVKYKKKEYITFFLFTISGSALISSLTFLLFTAAGYETAAKQDNGFFYTLVFSCFIPAFFEEWFVRGGMLGALAKYGGIGMWTCGFIFALMHSGTNALYAVFSGVLITAIVYVTECIYLGMLLHFLNNFISMLLSYLSGGAEYIALFVIIVVFAVCFVLLGHSMLLADINKALFAFGKEDKKAVFTPLLFIILLLTRILL
ncbi:MAG: CPBP family intramembrane metalloprotease [Clostridia bacterium]|nr:CPBP family intramembrane metalloprotease [Clostridia bacterium]